MEFGGRIGMGKGVLLLVDAPELLERIVGRFL